MSDKKVKVEKSNPSVLYTFAGMPKKEAEAWLASKRAVIDYPKTAKYQIYKTDKGATLAAKEDRRRAFMKKRLEELQEKLAEHQRFRVIGDLYFQKGEPLDAMNLVGEDADGKPFTYALPNEQLFKLDSLTLLGVFKREPKLSEKRVAELHAAKPKVPK
jgi:hypothetical protein